jgi:hypothetical protein
MSLLWSAHSRTAGLLPIIIPEDEPFSRGSPPRFFTSTIS